MPNQSMPRRPGGMLNLMARFLLHPAKYRNQHQQQPNRHERKIERCLPAVRLKYIPRNDGPRCAAEGRKNHDQARHRTVLAQRQTAKNG